MLPLSTLSGRGFCPQHKRSRFSCKPTRSGPATAAALLCRSTTPNPTDSCSSSQLDGLDNDSLAAIRLGRRQLALTAAVAAAAQWLVLPQPAAARGASSQKVDPQLLAAFQEALSANSYEVNSIAGLMDALIVRVVPYVCNRRSDSKHWFQEQYLRHAGTTRPDTFADS
jgi:hypothetical protein